MAGEEFGSQEATKLSEYSASELVGGDLPSCSGRRSGLPTATNWDRQARDACRHVRLLTLY